MKLRTLFLSAGLLPAVVSPAQLGTVSNPVILADVPVESCTITIVLRGSPDESHLMTGEQCVRLFNDGFE